MVWGNYQPTVAPGSGQWTLDSRGEWFYCQPQAAPSTVRRVERVRGIDCQPQQAAPSTAQLIQPREPATQILLQQLTDDAPNSQNDNASQKEPRRKLRHVCFAFKHDGRCRFGDRCFYVHGADDPRLLSKPTTRKLREECVNSVLQDSQVIHEEAAASPTGHLQPAAGGSATRQEKREACAAALVEAQKAEAIRNEKKEASAAARVEGQKRGGVVTAMNREQFRATLVSEASKKISDSRLNARLEMTPAPRFDECDTPPAVSGNTMSNCQLDPICGTWYVVQPAAGGKTRQDCQLNPMSFQRHTVLEHMREATLESVGHNGCPRHRDPVADCEECLVITAVRESLATAHCEIDDPAQRASSASEPAAGGSASSASGPAAGGGTQLVTHVQDEANIRFVSPGWQWAMVVDMMMWKRHRISFTRFVSLSDGFSRRVQDNWATIVCRKLEAVLYGYEPTDAFQ